MKLTVLMPVYNEKDTIEEIVEKVRAVEGGFEKEIVIVDDKSDDGTVDILKNIGDKYPDIQIYFKDSNTGKGNTLSYGFKKTTGDYVIVQDADLEYDPEDYKKLLRALEEDDVDVVYGL